MCKRESISKLEMAIKLMQEAKEEIGQDLEYLSKEVSMCDMELADLSHYLEFAEVTDLQASVVAKEMKVILAKRREVKNQREMARSINQMIEARESEFEVFDKILERINKRESSINNKTYTPRIRVELFENLK